MERGKEVHTHYFMVQRVRRGETDVKTIPPGKLPKKYREDPDVVTIMTYMQEHPEARIGVAIIGDSSPFKLVPLEVSRAFHSRLQENNPTSEV